VEEVVPWRWRRSMANIIIGQQAIVKANERIMKIIIMMY